MKSLIVLLGLVSLSYGSAIWSKNQVKDPACCVPSPFQMTFIGEQLFDYPGAAVPFHEMLAIYASQDGIAGVKYLDRYSGKLQERVVIDYKNGYIYNVTSGGCVKQPFKEAQPSGCLPDDAKWVGEYRMGNGLDSLYGYTFQFADPSKKLQEDLSVSKNCIPIHLQKTVTNGQGAVVQNGGIVNPSLKITEKGIFDIPGSCSTLEAGRSDFKTYLLPFPSFVF